MFLYQKKIPVNYNKGVFLGYEYDSLDRINNDSSIQNILNTIEKIDTEIRERITKQVQASSRSLMRDIVFSIAPIVVLVALQRFIG